MTQEIKQALAPTLADILKPNITKLAALADSLDNLRKALELTTPRPNLEAEKEPKTLAEHLHVVYDCATVLGNFRHNQGNDAYLAVQVLYSYKGIMAAVNFRQEEKRANKTQAHVNKLYIAVYAILESMALLLDPAARKAGEELLNFEESIKYYER